MILKKLGDEYKLYSHDSCIATTHESPYKKLSLKNCEAIANGYDLEELVKERFGEAFWHDGDKYFKEGFKKAVEILSDKKFSENDLGKAWSEGYHRKVSEINGGKLNYFDDLIKSLQQTQWEVEIEMEQDYLKWKQSDIEDIKDCLVPKLDAENCLILKRK